MLEREFMIRSICTIVLAISAGLLCFQSTGELAAQCLKCTLIPGAKNCDCCKPPREPARNLARLSGHGYGRGIHYRTPAYDHSYYNPWSHLNTPRFAHLPPMHTDANYGYGHQSYGQVNQGFGYSNQNFGNGNHGFGNQGFGNQGFGNQGPVLNYPLPVPGLEQPPVPPIPNPTDRPEQQREEELDVPKIDSPSDIRRDELEALDSILDDEMNPLPYENEAPLPPSMQNGRTTMMQYLEKNN